MKPDDAHGRKVRRRIGMLEHLFRARIVRAEDFVTSAALARLDGVDLVDFVAGEAQARSEVLARLGASA